MDGPGEGEDGGSRSESKEETEGQGGQDRRAESQGPEPTSIRPGLGKGGKLATTSRAQVQQSLEGEMPPMGDQWGSGGRVANQWWVL